MIYKKYVLVQQRLFFSKTFVIDSYAMELSRKIACKMEVGSRYCQAWKQDYW